MNNIIEKDIREIVDFSIPWEYLNNKSILVTGATGMLAFYIVETLMFLNVKHNANIVVYALSRDIARAKRMYKHHCDSKLKHIMADLNEPISFEEKINIVIHAASLASPKFYKTTPVFTIKPNVMGTSNLLDICVKNNAEQFLMFSSSEIYGAVDSSNKFLTEENYGVVDPLDLRSCYAESKRMAETMCVSWAEQYGLTAKIARPFHTYGPGMRLDDGRVFADFVSNIVNNEDIVLNSDGMSSRPFCYITDATRAFFIILLKGESKNAYNVANPEQNIKIRDLASLLVDIFSEKKLEVRFSSKTSKYYMPSKVIDQLPCIEKIKKLGWVPEIDVREGFYRTVMSYE